MGVLKRKSWLAHFGVALALVVLSGARAGAVVGEVSGTATDRAGTLLLFPKIIADGTRDTLVQITNTLNTERFAHCLYVNAAAFCSSSQELCTLLPGGDSDCPLLGETCVPQWQELNFDISLTRQQPTIWRVSTGRTLNATDEEGGNCSEEEVEGVIRQSCPGIDPGSSIPPPPQPFRGELKCVETDEGGAPRPGNALKGEALLETLGSVPPQVSAYNSINIEASDGESADGDNTEDFALKLANGEFNVCPDTIEFSNYAHLAQDPIAADAPGAICSTNGLCSGGANPGAACTTGGGECDGGTCQTCPVRTEITFIPCTQNFELGLPIPTVVQVRSIDELETSQSAILELNCWANYSLDEINPNIFNEFNRGDFLKTRIFTSPTGTRCLRGSVFTDGTNPSLNCDDNSDCGTGGVCGPQPGVLAIIEEFHEWDGSLGGSGAAGSAAANGHMIGQRTGLCRNNLTVSCNGPDDCAGGGFCRIGGAACTTDGACTGGSPEGEPNRCDICMVDEVIIPSTIPGGPVVP